MVERPTTNHQVHGNNPDDLQPKSMRPTLTFWEASSSISSVQMCALTWPFTLQIEEQGVYGAMTIRPISLPSYSLHVTRATWYGQC
jgi:hypothetical protein